jgi:hypothetical protein
MSIKGSFGKDDQPMSEQTSKQEFKSPAVAETMQDELTQIAIEAWRKYPSGTEAIARRDHVMNFLRDDLTWVMIDRWQPWLLQDATRWLLDGARVLLRGGDLNAARIGRVSVVSHERSGPGSKKSARSVAREEGAGRKEIDHQCGDARPSQPFNPPSTAGMAARAKVAGQSLLESFTISGRPIGDFSAGEAKSWANRAGLHVRFVTMLTAGLPEGDQIRKWIKPDEADAIWRRAAEGV